MADFMHHRAEERSLFRLLDIVLVEGHDTGMRFPVTSRPQAAWTAPSGFVCSQLDPGHVDDKAGAGFPSGPDTDFPPVGAVVSDQPTLGLTRLALPLLPCVVNPPAPGLTGTFERRLEWLIVAHLARRTLIVEVDGKGVGGTARPASISHSAAIAQQRDGIVVAKAGCDRTSVRPPRGFEQGLEIVHIVGFRRRRQEPGPTMPPMIEKIVRIDVVLGTQRNAPGARRRAERKCAASSRARAGSGFHIGRVRSVRPLDGS